MMMMMMVNGRGSSDSGRGKKEKNTRMEKNKVFPIRNCCSCSCLWLTSYAGYLVVQLEEILFGAFEEQPNWKLEQLRQYTKQPMVYSFTSRGASVMLRVPVRSGYDKW